MQLTDDMRKLVIDYNNGVVAVKATNFMTMKLPPRTCLMEPWLPSSGLAMVYAYRGVGKTFFALNVAHAVATGTEFLEWNCPHPQPVLYMDGEMPASDMQARMRSIERGKEMPFGENMTLITPDIQDIGLTNLASKDSRDALHSFTTDAQLIIVDNIATLCRVGKENDSDAWTVIQHWALQMRSEGRSVMFIHHAGKAGGQRGTSGREDVLDTVIKLQRPQGVSPTEGANFEIHFEKNRGFTGEHAQAFNAAMTIEDGCQRWDRQSLADSTFNRCVELAKAGLSQGEIADKLKVNKSTVSRHLKKAKAEGLIPKFEAD